LFIGQQLLQAVRFGVEIIDPGCIAPLDQLADDP